MSKNSIVFIGGKKKGYEILKSLINLTVTISAVYIMEEDDHEIERYSDHIKHLCKKKSIFYKVTNNLNLEKSYIKQLNPKLIVVNGWRRIISEEILVIPSKGCIAFHESLLPKYRGFAPINWAIINGEKVTGVTLFYLSNEVDNGDIINQQKIIINQNDTAYDIYLRTIDLSKLMLNKYINDIMNGKVVKKKQNNSKATYCCLRLPVDGKINWQLPNYNIHNQIRGLSYPYPGAYSYINNKKIIIRRSIIPKQKLWEGYIPGRIINVDKRKGVEVLTGKGTLLITEIEVDNKNTEAVKLLNSIKLTLN